MSNRFPPHTTSLLRQLPWPKPSLGTEGLHTAASPPWGCSTLQEAMSAPGAGTRGGQAQGMGCQCPAPQHQAAADPHWWPTALPWWKAPWEARSTENWHPPSLPLGKLRRKNHPTRSSSCDCQGGKSPARSEWLSYLQRCAEPPWRAPLECSSEWGTAACRPGAPHPSIAQSHPHRGDREGCCESEEHTESDGWLYTLGEFCSTCMFYIYIRAL